MINSIYNETLFLYDAKWFKPQPVGINKLNYLMKNYGAAATWLGSNRISAASIIVRITKVSNPSTMITRLTGGKVERGYFNTTILNRCK